MLYID